MFKVNKDTRRLFIYLFSSIFVKVLNKCLFLIDSRFYVVFSLNTGILITNWYLLDCLKIFRSSHQRCTIKKQGGLKNFLKFTGKHQCQSLFFNKAPSWKPATGTLTQLFSCEFCESFKNTFFTANLWTTNDLNVSSDLYFFQPKLFLSLKTEKKFYIYFLLKTQK